MKKIIFPIISLLAAIVTNNHAAGSDVIKYSTAGFYDLPNTGRTVQNMNPAWRFAKDPSGSAINAHQKDFDDKAWDVVSLPNGMQYLPTEASGGVNYRGASWYRKHFSMPPEIENKRLVLYFEAIMGKSKIWVNGQLVKEHFGGFLPVAVDITDKLNVNAENVIAVWCDNSNDPMYPPGKQQEMLDFCYFGGIYRDCWLIATNREVYITDENMSDKIGGGGVFISYPKISEQEAVINIQADIVGNGKPSYILRDRNGNIVAKSSKNELRLNKPQLWSPERPYLYQMEVRVTDSKGMVVDGYMKKIGLRTIEFSHKEGFILNGRHYPRKLIGANRHQDFAVIGNALSNNLHWRDAQKLKECGMEVIRNAHYPQDPAFMDACDELGLFVIVNTPGWQFWNEDPLFGQRVYDDIRQMVRRDRFRAGVLMWEPILNETWYPSDFAHTVNEIVKEELPGAYTGSDQEARGAEYFDVNFRHPLGTDKNDSVEEHTDSTKTYFTREFGDNVDDWNSHNSPSRVAVQWGEIPQLIQAMHYCNPDYPYTSIVSLRNSPKHHFGGALWHSFDHQRGYHPDPFYGGVMTAFRRPKYSYYVFQSQAEFGEPMVFIANEMTPFSPQDVTVFTNCDAVRLRTYFGDTLRVKKREGAWVTFEKAFSFMEDKALSRKGLHRDSYILAEGLNEAGEVVASDKRMMSRRAFQLRLLVDTLGATPVADGGDLFVVVAQMVDKEGVVKRLNNAVVRFDIEGEGRLIGSAGMETNPVPVLWGEAPILVQTTTKSGDIKIMASVVLPGDNTPLSGEIVVRSANPPYQMIYDSCELQDVRTKNHDMVVNNMKVDLKKRADIESRLREVEQQQEDFGEKK